ncbi:UNVERIFIED_ORG: hypothetical protein GCAPEGMB_00415 [Vibrio phage V07]
MVHVVNKGKEGEREFIKFLQPMVDEVYEKLGLEPVKLFRNQNQSALGGYDIDGIPWLAIEIKRQEQLSINTWWNQVLKATGEHQVPLLAFRQNRKQWRFMVWSHIHTGGSGYVQVRSELNKEDFERWFKARLAYEAVQEGGV